MKQIRLGVFETNSSSSHSLMIVTKEEYNKLLVGELLIDKYTDKVVSSPSEAKYPDDVVTYDDYMDNYMESFKSEYTTPSGDEIVVFGYYGYDG